MTAKAWPDGYATMHAQLEESGYRDINHPELHPGRRIRHRAEQWPEASSDGTGAVLAVMERDPSSWSASYHRRDIELIVLMDRPLLTGMSRLSQLADYHVIAIGGAQ